MIERLKHWITTTLGAIMILAGIYLLVFSQDTEAHGSTLIVLGGGFLGMKDDKLKKLLKKNGNKETPAD